MYLLVLEKLEFWQVINYFNSMSMAFLCKFISLESAACVNTYYDIIALCPMNVITFFIF